MQHTATYTCNTHMQHTTVTPNTHYHEQIDYDNRHNKTSAPAKTSSRAHLTATHTCNTHVQHTRATHTCNTLQHTLQYTHTIHTHTQATSITARNSRISQNGSPRISGRPISPAASSNFNRFAAENAKESYGAEAGSSKWDDNFFTNIFGTSAEGGSEKEPDKNWDDSYLIDLLGACVFLLTCCRVLQSVAVLLGERLTKVGMIRTLWIF